MKQALEQARRARLFILDKMNATLAEPRTPLSPYAPRITTITIPTEKIRDLIGKGGSTIRGIVDTTGAKIDVEDDGSVKIYSSDGVAADKCIQMVTDICAVAEMGKTYLGKVVRIVDFGAFVEIFPGTDGLLHISEIAENRIREAVGLDEVQLFVVSCPKDVTMYEDAIKTSGHAERIELRELTELVEEALVGSAALQPA